jgi:thymidylate synthase ThyX
VKLEHGNFRPKEWRFQDTKNKQSSFGILPQAESDRAYALLDLAYFVQDYVYSELQNMGIAREQARISNAVGQYTQCMWTGSLQAVMHFLTLRNKPEAQKETRDYAKGIQQLAYEVFPKSLELIDQVIDRHELNIKNN